MTQISLATCRSEWIGVDTITEKHICFYDADTPLGDRADTCSADSGGPVMCGCGHNVLAGVMSWGPWDCSGSEPAVYTRVSEYRDWIKQHTGV